MTGNSAIPAERSDFARCSHAANAATRWGPATGAGPLGEKVAGTFQGGSYTEMVTGEATTLYRAHDGTAGDRTCLVAHRANRSATGPQGQCLAS